MTEKLRECLRLEQVSLSASVGSSDLLNDISFEVYSGDRLSIIGPSGAGKSTLLRLLNRLVDPTQGTIYYNASDYCTVSVQQLRREVVLVLQEPKLLGMTVAEALTYPLQLQQLSPKDIQQRVDYWRQQFHIPEDWWERQELQLSLGQRQWVSIARAMVMQPKVLLLDEPTSALDAGRAESLVDILTQWGNHSGMSMIMVNHQLDIAQRFSDRVLYLSGGQLQQDTPAHQLDWKQLRQDLIQTEIQLAKEWET